MIVLQQLLWLVCVLVVLQMKIILIFLSIIGFALAFTPELVELQLQIAQLQTRNSQLSYKRCRKNDINQQDQHSISLQPSPISFSSNCSFNQSHLETFLLQSANQIYLLINFQHLNLAKIYSSQCVELSTFENLQIYKLITDRGHMQSGLAFFIGKDQNLYAVHEEGGFKNKAKIANLTQQTKLIGGVVRYRSKDKVQIFIVYEDGSVRVFEESGNRKLSFSLANNKMQIETLVDRHPYPLVSTNSDWILLLDTTKYSEIQQICPHIANIKAIVLETQYNDVLYVLTLDKIYAVSLEHIKRQCVIKHEYFVEPQLNKINEVSLFGNYIFIDNKIFNLTEKKLHRLSECKGQLVHQFAMKKNHPDQNYGLKKCCTKDNCYVEFGKLSKKLQDRRVFLWLTICFALVIVVSLSFMKKTTVSNLDIDDTLQQRERNLDRQLYQKSKHKKQRGGKDKRK